MASSGATAWAKYYQGKGNVQTVMKSDSALYDGAGKNIGVLRAGDSVTVIPQDKFTSRYPVQDEAGRVGFVTFNNIQKPKTKRTQGIKLKPQDFKCIRDKQVWLAKDLAKALVDEVQERQDLDPKLKNYLVVLTQYHAELNSVNQTDVNEAYSVDLPGLAEIQKDYGEMLGAIACIVKNIIPGMTLAATTKINFPIRGNEPIVDYYLEPAGGKQIAISAKSGDTTNTLKPGDIINLLDTAGKKSKWQQTITYKLMQIIADKSIAAMPFYAINLLHPKLLPEQALKDVDASMKSAKFATKAYNFPLYDGLFKILGYKVTSPPTVGELFYNTEKYIVKYMNEKYADDAGKIFADATAGLVTYVRFKITAGARVGVFEVSTSDAVTTKKKDVKWRSKNATTRAADKLGLQP